MAVCRWCAQEMTTASSCIIDAFHVDGWAVQMIAYGTEPGGGALRLRCSDCGVARGGHHHRGCDVQRCPSCRGLLMTRGCRFDEDEHDDDVDDDDSERASEPLMVDRNGLVVERRWVGETEVIVRSDDIPPSDRTRVDGIP
jgi:hypothetical protein